MRTSFVAHILSPPPGQRMSHLRIWGFLILFSYVAACTALVWAMLWVLLRFITDNNDRRIFWASGVAALFFLREFEFVLLR